MPTPDFQIIQRQHIRYLDALLEMDQIHALRVRDECADTFMVLEMRPVITKGRRLHGHPIPQEEKLKKQGIDIEEADRGGLLTYHGPGQAVIYPIIKFTQQKLGPADIVHRIEEAVQFFLRNWGLETEIKKDFPGIWVNEKKLASIGLRISDGVTKHGISLNISNDLHVYEEFEPCGLQGNVMTNLMKVLKNKLSDVDVINIGTKLAEYMGEYLLTVNSK